MAKIVEDDLDKELSLSSPSLPSGRVKATLSGEGRDIGLERGEEIGTSHPSKPSFTERTGVCDNINCERYAEFVPENHRCSQSSEVLK